MKFKHGIVLSLIALSIGTVITESASATVVRCQWNNQSECNEPDLSNNGSGDVRLQPIRFEYYNSNTHVSSQDCQQFRGSDGYYFACSSLRFNPN